ncbi:hypothetical protein Tco_0728336 [Tanacetum coccineum]|uniref:Uncharacterized protein n=1 Tax=Tanacetum coccineum TaxID=301880 RepID=A0ABQ4YLP7_9ASTR
MFSVCLCARFQEAPKTSHLEAVKRIFRYIKGNAHLGLWYPKGTGIETVVYADSGHAGDYLDRKRTSERKPRRDRGTRRGRHSTSSSSTFDQPSSSHLNDDDDDGNDKERDPCVRSTPSPIRYVNSLTNQVPQVFQNPPNIDPHLEPFDTCQTKIINHQVQLRDEQRGGVWSIGKILRRLWRKIRTTKKTQRNHLNQQYENFTAPSSEMLDQTFDRLQKLVSQLELLDEKLSREDVNQKLLRSLSPKWNIYVVVWRNKAELETISMDGLYNNLKVYEPEVKGMSSSSSSTQKMVFVSSSNKNTSSSNEAVKAAHGFTTAITQVNTAYSTNIDNLC